MKDNDWRKKRQLDKLWYPNGVVVLQTKSETLNKWKTNMEEVLPLVEDEEYLSSILSDHLKWIYSLTKVEDFTASHYVYNMDMAVVRMEHHL